MLYTATTLNLKPIPEKNHLIGIQHDKHSSLSGQQIKVPDCTTNSIILNTEMQKTRNGITGKY